MPLERRVYFVGDLGDFFAFAIGFDLLPPPPVAIRITTIATTTTAAAPASWVIRRRRVASCAAAALGGFALGTRLLAALLAGEILLLVDRRHSGNFYRFPLKGV